MLIILILVAVVTFLTYLKLVSTIKNLNDKIVLMEKQIEMLETTVIAQKNINNDFLGAIVKIRDYMNNFTETIEANFDQIFKKITPEPKKIKNIKINLTLDSILDKISQYGYESLSIEEKKWLQNYNND